MLKVILLAAAAVLSFAGAADAATLYITLGATPTASISGINLPSIANIDADSYINPVGVVGTSSVNGTNGATMPIGPLLNNEYLYINGNTSPGGSGSATFDLASKNTNIFGFTWGTVDGYEHPSETNILTLTDAQTSYTFDGTTIWGFVKALQFPLLDNNCCQVDVLFFDPTGAIRDAVFTSNKVSFEVANLTAVPLPGAALLFGSGLAGLIGVARKKARR